MRVLIATEPAMYREVISATLREVRPHLEIFAAEPENLDREVLRLAPWLVVCSRLTGTVERRAPAWVELYPGGGTHAVVSLDGTRTGLSSADFGALLSVVDRAGRLYGSA